jgi:hypothetical protein
VNEKTRKVFAGWLNLSETERIDFDSEVAKYKQGSSTTKDSIRESVRKSGSTRMETGPLGPGGCPCCGR